MQPINEHKVVFIATIKGVTIGYKGYLILRQPLSEGFPSPFTLLILFFVFYTDILIFVDFLVLTILLILKS